MPRMVTGALAVGQSETRVAAPLAPETSSEREYAWAVRSAIVARQGDRVHRVQAPASPGGVIPAGAWREITARDSAMADNVRWVVEREGAGGRVLVFAHDLHVKNASTVGGPWPLERPPTAMGQYLRTALDDRLVLVGSVGGAPPAAVTGAEATVDAALARPRIPRFVLDLRRISSPAVHAWLSGRQTLRVNGDAVIALLPSTAFDALVYLGSLTPARRNSP